eukprot:TRINITY_DN3758_c0_g5_i1.p1 TRINITY_DN3758_c0_g5~~TRINITY_DN3758_c0_g5_i1.p1  ORF type:complete len:216 (-),score=43.80 TRINITY_DN3758_c0_g5_i1:121-735(-)
MGVCCCCCAARDGGVEEPLKTPLRPTRPDKAENVVSMQMKEAEKEAALQSPEANGAVEEVEAATKRDSLLSTPSSTKYTESLNESFEVEGDVEGAEWSFVGYTSNITEHEVELITQLLNAMVSLETFADALEREKLRTLFWKFAQPWAEDEKQLYFHNGGFAGNGHQKTAEFRVLSWDKEYTLTLTWAWDAVLDEEDFKFPSSA